MSTATSKTMRVTPSEESDILVVEVEEYFVALDPMQAAQLMFVIAEWLVTGRS